jgi:GAF domain-containing protein
MIPARIVKIALWEVAYMDNKKITLSPEVLGKVEALFLRAMGIKDAAIGSIQIFNPLTKCLQLLHHHGLTSAFVKLHENITSSSDTVCAKTYRMANSLMIAEIDTDVFFKRQTKTGEENNFKALHCAPIFSKANEVIGILTTYYDDSLYLSEYEIQLKNTVAAELAPILENLIINHSKIILN